jgi:hypothetical protein
MWRAKKQEIYMGGKYKAGKEEREYFDGRKSGKF